MASYSEKGYKYQIKGIFYGIIFYLPKGISSHFLSIIDCLCQLFSDFISHWRCSSL
ncbi:hypothetical protein LEQ41_08530 [Streptococcus agalactiae]|nr:hypothetical protein [Streptococcus agalactiae]